MVRSRLGFVAATALVLGSAIMSAPPRTVAVEAAPSIGFEVPSIVDPIHTFGEPDIGVDAKGRVFSSGPTGTGTQRSVWFGSVDRGHTYREISPCALAPFPPPSSLGCPVPGPLVGTMSPPGGGDTDIAFDHTGKQFFADLYALTCLRTATTPDAGATVYQQAYPAGCAGLPGADRQWLAVFDPQVRSTSAYTGPLPLVYMEYNNLSGAQWVKSNSTTDPSPGGPGLAYTNAEVDGPGLLTGYQPYGADGYPSIDQVTGNVFQASYGGDQAGTDPTKVYLNIGYPVDATGQLKFLDAPATSGGSEDPTKLIVVARNVVNNSGEAANFVVSSMDSARNLYVVWVNRSTVPSDRQVFVSAASPTGPNGPWTNWTAPVKVSDGSTSTGDAVNVFPWIKAGGAGRADAVWYGSDKSVDPSAQLGQKWNVFMSQVVFPVDAQGRVTGAAPQKTLVKVSPHPSHYDDICLAGTACIVQQGNRNLADFFNIAIDKTGAAEIVYDDTSNGLIQNPVPSGPVDHSGAPLVTVARQSSGPGLFGGNVAGPSNTPVSGVSDNRGDALFPVIGGNNVSAMDLLSSQMQLSGNTLKVTSRVADLSTPATVAARAAIPGAAYLQYVTRWQMGDTLYYAALEIDAANQQTFFAGKTQSIDLCSVSACFPHVLVYPEPTSPTLGGTAETGSVQCPSSPSASNPCTVTITVNLGDIGNPTATSLLEQVGAYAFASAHRQGDITNAQAQADDVPLEIDGTCCYNFKAAIANGGPPPCREGDGDGEVRGRSSNANVHVDADACEDQDRESVDVQDSGSGADFHSTQLQSVTFDDVANTMTIVGTGTNAGHPVTFTAVGVNGSAGVGTFTLILSDGYSLNGTLLTGSIQLN